MLVQASYTYKDVGELRHGIEEALEIVSSPDFLREKIVKSIEHRTPVTYAQAFVKAVQYMMSE